MSDQLISRADLSTLEKNMHVLNSQIEQVSGQVAYVGSELSNTQNQLNDLISEFKEFVRTDLLNKNLQLAETRLVKVRQKIENEFGHYEKIRKQTTGILQAVDTSLIKKSTIETATEENLINAPSYWLAPCLIALSAWLNDNKELANKSIREAIRRDDEKTSLFFALVCRRGLRYEASSRWINRYLGIQNPNELERNVVILIDGIANGVFGAGIKDDVIARMEKWIDELDGQAGAQQERIKSWKFSISSLKEQEDGKKYPYLSGGYLENWNEVKNSMEDVKLNSITLEHFKNIMNTPIEPSKTIAYAVDSLLDKLVSGFDNEELPLRKEERLNALVIEKQGDTALAKEIFEKEKVFEQEVPFTQLLNNCAINPEESKASLATQKMATGLSKKYIVQAYGELTAEYRNRTPRNFDLKINEWSGTTEDGENELELEKSLKDYYDKKEKEALDKLHEPIGKIIGAVVCLVVGFGLPVLFIGTIILGIMALIQHNDVKKKKEDIPARIRSLYENDKEKLLACLAEIVDWKNEYEKNDVIAEEVKKYIENIKPEEYLFSTYEKGRNVLV